MWELDMGQCLDGTRRRNGTSRGAVINDTRRMSRNIERDRGGARVEGTTVSFTGGSTVSDSGNGLGSFIVGLPVLISGAATNANNGLVLPSAVAAGSLTVQGKTVVTESAGANIEVRLG